LPLMSWLKDIVRPRIATRTRRGVRADIWQKCPDCGEMIYEEDLTKGLYTCPSCHYHMPISLDDRFEYLLDKNSLEVLDVIVPKADPLKFKDKKRYTDRLKDAQKNNNNKDAFKAVKASMNGKDLIVCAFDFSFMAGSMGAYVGEALVASAEEALKRKLPLLIIPASGGARMQEGIISLMQMARSTAAIQKVKEAGLPYLVLLTHPTTGGVTASFAMIGDIMMAEPKCLIGFAGPRVIQQTIGETLPEGFQTAEYLCEHGMLDMVTSRQDQKERISKILSILSANK
jgi:acetyl-CoA carboxylase carboxyl transferase subunit beta